MNGRKAKAIRKQALVLLYEWVKTLVSEEEAKNMKPEEALALLPKDTHIYANRRIMLSAFSFKWIIKKIKIFLKTNNKRINQITLEDINGTNT
tara:strand:+ start:548 stop:826 length:279 start_codon:yes stop_codon:yes gene_type:complete